ncbi:hypothetical protein [Streptomyces sp. CBG33]|uniref:deoxynucleotide monophosphate kinase family protein n=1 Tax=Streptomyces sp. CBG33 TaxID=2762624 RepID=UPI001647E62C|nr:hypothetical protein [Streptomyces sp. CBG33]
MLPNIGIIGRARVGKDTAGAWLVENRGYKRVAFADPLKEAALRVDPTVALAPKEVWDIVYGEWELVRTDTNSVRLSTAVADLGWEKAKDAHPEARRILQELGAAIRTIDEDFWLRAAMKKVQDANDAGHPAVVTDVRYPNEAESLRRAGFQLLYIHRPGVPHLDHESEGALGASDADHLIINDGGLADLVREVHLVADRAERLAAR